MKQPLLRIPDPIRRFLAETISTASGNEVYFLARVIWRSDASEAEITEVDVFARGNQVSTPAIIEGAEDWDLAIHNHPGEDLTPSEADVDVASELGNRAVGFAIIDNRAERCYIVVPPFRRQTQRAVDPEVVAAIFQSGGSLDRQLSETQAPGAYEFRSGQIAMAREVTRALNGNGVVALEAGTGVGKSFAYLVPAILWAVLNKKRVIVSTNTINLQEQLITKDLPFLEKALGEKFAYAIITGRGNYACLRKAAEARNEPTLLFDSDDDDKVLRDLLEWVERTSEGSLSDLGMTPPEDVWERVMSETDKSLKVNCPFYQRCFYYTAKRRAFKADILVVNHHLFFADLAMRKESGNYQWDLILPGYDRVIFDEAHHLEDVASRHLGVRFSQLGILRRLTRLVSARDSSRGILPNLARKLRREGAHVAADRLENHYIPQVPEIRERIDEQFQAVALAAEGIARVQARAGENSAMAQASTLRAHQAGPTGNRFQVRFTPQKEMAGFRKAVVDHLDDVRRQLELLSRINGKALGAVKAATIEEQRRASLSLELSALSTRLDRLLESIQFFADVKDTTHTRWMEVKSRRGLESSTVQFATSPIRVADDLRQAVYDPLEAVVMTSATLSVEGRIDFLSDRVGLDKVDSERFGFSVYDSPFAYSRQVLALVPTDFPDPRQPGYVDRLVETIIDVLERLKGRTFVLFTSYTMLRTVFDRVEERLLALGMRPLRQGETNRSELLRRFRSGPHHVLFATDSFWEGVDVKGRALECVIITRLPFRVPSDPLQMARVEDLERRGVASFTHFTVPQAVLKFKQGFGRLIRSESDRGVVFVLDRRIVTQRYGRAFIDSLPPVRWVSGKTVELLGEVEEFFGTHVESNSATRQPSGGGN